eukprot:TRINITY_DN23165_c0_g1_i1.p1 TRINITY_DN23165_c0_g1~~TRINITY_DN23165_c0_g1_i1.p1  ORF type:complete len:173 (-),score=30.83 TRINITY_DN23165_c0_g1_i1:60-578(-)
MCIRDRLSVYQSLLASQNCANDFNAFITFIIAPLAKDGRVGFFPKGTATDYDASDAMSVNTCDNLLQLLAMAKSPLLCNEAPFVVEWVMHSAYHVDVEAVPLFLTCAMLMSVVGPCDIANESHACLLYTSDAADDLLCVDFGGCRIIKKKKKYDIVVIGINSITKNSVISYE